jgi:hypothetical protein
VANQKIGHSPYLIILLIPMIIFLASACTYQGDEFTFTAPFGFKTKQYETPAANLNNKTELLVFSQQGHLYFQIFRQRIPQGSDLETVLAENISRTSQLPTAYRFISKNGVEINDRPAIEYIHREFAGEPYVQRREIWMEYNGRAYALVCTNPADATPGATVPVPELCIQLVEGFKLK